MNNKKLDENYNSGDDNSGNDNSGNYNSGNYNSGNYNSGFFNTDTPTVRMFNKDTRLKWGGITFPGYMYFDLTLWIDADDMTPEEKQANPSWKTTGGYLKTLDYKEAWKLAWDKATQEEKEQTKNLPNFDPDIFLEITGIDVKTQEDPQVARAIELLKKKGKLKDGKLINV